MIKNVYFSFMVFFAAIALGLTGCGGGDSGGVAGDGGDDTITVPGAGPGLAISLTLVDPLTDITTTSISAASPGELRAIVSYDGALVAQEVVIFTTSIGTLSPASSLTTTAGLAAVALEDGGTAGAGTVTATVTLSNGSTASDTYNFQISDTPPVPGVTVDMGNGVGGAFVVDVVDLGGVTTLAAGGTLTATVSVVETSNSNVAYATPVTVTFSSACVVAGTATMDATVVTTAGIASSTYLAQGCTGSDTITATADVGNIINASVGLTVQSAGVGSIEFVSAAPESISLRGTGGSGGTETSIVTFRVVDAQGSPVANQVVSFSLNTVTGGLGLSPTSATSDQNGLVQTVVQSGTVSTSVSVTASTTSGANSYQTQSSALVVTTGIPDQDSFTLSASLLSPEGWVYSGVTSEITARLADRFNNPVPDGTAVTFTTEGGSIGGSCTTTGGACSVTWTSQNPGPCGQVIGASTVVLNPLSGPNVCELAGGTNATAPVSATAPLFIPSLGRPYGGRATIVATAIGEESFIDVNGNYVFDDGDTTTDKPEAWLDSNEDGSRGAYEPFFDFNVSGDYTAADGEFNGVLCDRTVAPLCSTNTSLHVRQSLVLVMSGSAAEMELTPSTFNIPCGSSVDFNLVYSDLHHQPMPAGTKVAITSSHGSVVFGSSFTQADTNNNDAINFNGNLEGSGTVGTTSTKNGTLVVTITSPKGLVTVSPSHSVSEICI